MIYLNVGSGKSIRERDIIGIFDMDTSTVSSITRKYLSDSERFRLTESATSEIPKSFVVYYENGENKVIFSQFSSTALLGRIESKMVR